MEIIPVQHRDQAKTVLELHTFHLTVRLRMLKDDCKHLFARCNQDSMSTIIMRRRFRWIGHVMRREPGNIPRTALHWTPGGKRKRGRPKNTWHRTVEGELKTLHQTWGTVQKLAQNRQGWSTFVATLHASRHYGHEWSEQILLNSNSISE